MRSMSAGSLAALVGIVFLGSLARGFTGFGAVLFTLPLAALVLPVKQAVPLLAALGLTNGVWLVWSARRWIHPVELGRLLAGGIPGVALGLALFHRAPEGPLRAVLGAAVVALGVWLAFGGGLPRGGQGWHPASGPAAGAAGGLLGGLYGLSGPGPLFYLAGRPLPHPVLRATLLAFITALDVILGIAFTASGYLDTAAWGIGVGLFPAAALGSWCGTRLHERVPETVFRRVVGAGLVVMGLLLVRGALWPPVGGAPQRRASESGRPASRFAASSRVAVRLGNAKRISRRPSSHPAG